MTDFDFEILHHLLYDATNKAFLSVQRSHAEEHFYLFGLYTSGDLAFLVPTASTEEGLSKVAEFYMKEYRDKYYSGFSFQDMRDLLRWSPADSPLHSEGEAYFSEVNKLIENVPEILDEFPKGSWEKFDDFVNMFINVCIHVLKKIDSEGTFGKDEDRNKLILNLLMGDQSNQERLKYAKLLNPPIAFERFKSELSKERKVYKNNRVEPS